MIIACYLENKDSKFVPDLVKCNSSVVVVCSVIFHFTTNSREVSRLQVRVRKYISIGNICEAANVEAITVCRLHITMNLE